MYYCGRERFADAEDEAEKGRAALERCTKRGFFSFGARKKAMFINLLNRHPSAESEIPLSTVRLLHAYCNFSIYSGHENAKYLGFLASFVNPEFFRTMVNKHGLVDIWVCDAKLLRDLTVFSSVARYKDRFHVL
jgi:hypothetical protein